MKRPANKIPNFKPILEIVEEHVEPKLIKTKIRKGKSVSTYTKTTGRLNPYY